MKTKQTKEELDKTLDEDIKEPKTRARKKASDANDEGKQSQDEPKASKDKKTQSKPRAVVKKRPLGIRKALRSKKTAIVKEKVKNVIKQKAKRGRKPAIKPDPDVQDKDAAPLIPASDIKKEPGEEASSNSRSESPKTGRSQREMAWLMKHNLHVLNDSPSARACTLLGSRTSPYSMRSERSNSPSVEAKNLRSGKPRKVKNNLLNEVVMKEQKKRRRLLSDSKNPEIDGEDCKKLKRGRSCSGEGSEVSKCSDNTESDLSMSETLNDSDSRELNKKLDKKTDIDVDIENNIQISTIVDKVPSLNVDSKAEPKPDAETSSIEKNKKPSLSLKRSTSLDADNNNSNRLKLETLNASDIEDKLLKTENDTLFEASRILTSMSKTFNSKDVTKNMKRARRGRKAASAGSRKPSVTQPAPAQVKNCTPTVIPDALDDKHETIETLSKDIDDLIKNLDQNIDGDHEPVSTPAVSDQMEVKSVTKFYGLNKPLSNVDNKVTPETPVKDKEISITNENTPSKQDDSENMRLHYDEDSVGDGSRQEVTTYNSYAIDKLMDRLKEFEEYDKRRQRLESESKSNDGKPMMVTNDVVLITKSGADIKPLKDIQSVRSPERPMEKENVLSCLENNSAISIVKRDQVRKSVDIDLPNSVTLIKRNSVSARKESTSSNHSRESDAISIFEKSLGKDVTLTEIRKSVDKSGTPAPVDLHQFATLHPTSSQIGAMLDSSQISITPRVSDVKMGSNDIQIISKRKSRESMSRKSSEPTVDMEEKLAVLEKIKTPPPAAAPVAPANVAPAPVAPAPVAPAPVAPASVAPAPVAPAPVAPASVAPGPVASAPVAVKSPEVTPVEPEALPPPVDNIKPILDDIPAASEIPKLDVIPDTKPAEIIEKTTKVEEQKTTEEKPKTEVNKEKSPEKVEEKPTTTSTGTTSVAPEVPKPENKVETKEIKEGVLKDEKVQVETKLDEIKPVKGPGRAKTSRTSIESQPGPSNALMETPETQKHKENVLRTLGLLTHKAANEAKIEKLKEKERIYSGMIKGKAKSSGDYTGTLKTVIKLNRSGGERERKKHRSSLKMTFQKSKYRTGKQFPEIGETQNEDETFYTIERREASGAGATDGAQRKSYSNRVNHDGEAVPEPAEPKETLNLVIPEKASSFSIHPGRLCQDQCFYCGGKFGLFDTPCHIAQIKSSERQKKVLDNEEKLTIDSCLCDACYRHVDRRANCPSYRKRPHKLDLTPSALPPQLATAVNQAEKPPSPTEEDSDEEPPSVSGVSSVSSVSGRSATCHTEGCSASADKSIRRKWLIKMRTSVNQVLSLKCDYPGLHTIPLCAGHHAALAPLMACTLCRRRLTKHHNVHFIHHGYTELNPALETALIPVQFTSRPVLCKGCRYYCSLLHRPGHNDNYAHGYRKKLLQIYNIEVPEMDTTTEITEDLNKPKKKQRNKSKQRKSTEAESNGSESSERTNDSTPEKKEQCDVTKPVEEDIESLISSNKIPVPNAKPNEPSDGSENDFEFEAPLLPLDKQTELQYLLQKQNNPAQFMNQPNLTQKQKNLMKLQSISGIQKPGQQHRISDKNARRIQKLGLMMAKEKAKDMEVFEEKARDPAPVLKNITLNEECTIESIPNKRPADINTLKNKWQMSESFTQVKRNLSELSKKLTVEKEPKKTTEVKYSNPVKRLETNPSISVRELFPGEDEMNLQCNIEFNNVKGVTPEGWEKCNTMIQYDVETKRLWHELQRPYGNQSSFLRHLVLLEKYFRSGDLVLSPNAAPQAMSYSDSVQNRLKAYDSTRKEPSSLLDFRKKPSLNGKSLLKSNQEDKDTKRFMPPPAPKVKKDKKSKQLPPELIAINTPNAQGRKAIQNVLHNIQQLVKGVSASDPTEVAAAPLPPKFEPPLPPPLPKEKKDVPKEKKDSPKIDSVTPAKTKSDTPKKSKTSSKPWRPTLMPITQENLSRIAREPTQLAVDGRALPSLVQVMSSGKRYHITLQDYNKMCIMRREKLQQLQDGDKKRPSISIDSTDNTIVTELQPSTMLGNGGSVTQVTNEEERKDDMQQIGSNAANILKNVGLKNITIAPILAKPQTVTSQTITIPMVSSPSLLVSTPIKIPQLSSSVTITSETVTSPLPIMASQMVMPKIPKSLTVIPQTVVANVPQNIVVTSPSILTTDGIRP